MCSEGTQGTMEKVVLDLSLDFLKKVGEDYPAEEEQQTVSQAEDNTHMKAERYKSMVGSGNICGWDMDME